MQQQYRGCTLGILFAKALAALLVFGTGAAWGAVVVGRVYLDANGNGSPDAGELGVARVAVSDGTRVAVTDANGGYRLEAAEAGALVWVSLPRDHAASGSFWRVCDGSASADFGLRPFPQSADFTFMQITDAHIGAADKVKRLGETVGKLPFTIDFLVNTGDLYGVDTVPLDQAAKQSGPAWEALRAFSLPQFHMPGNHEHAAFQVKDADATDPHYGKGLYRSLQGPTYYSWDWAGVHFVALDGTSLPYQERLGDAQLGWLRQDLALQAADKPVILFCHQVISSLRDAKELENVVRGKKVLGAFCGHIHRNYTVPFLDFTVYVSGALSGIWWSGPCMDGTPQGYRLVRIKDGILKTAYADREGLTPLSLVSPLANQVVKGLIEVEISVVDAGRPCTVTAEFSGQPVALRQTSREELWSFWKGTVDTRQAFDGARLLNVTAKSDSGTSDCVVRYLVENGLREPFSSDVPATLGLQVRGIREPVSVLLNGEALGEIPAGTLGETNLTFAVAREKLARLNRVTLRGSADGKARCTVGPVWMEVKGKKIHDQRFPSFERYYLGSPSQGCEATLYHVVP